MNIGVLMLRDGSHLNDHIVRFQFLVENFKAQNSTQVKPNFSNCLQSWMPQKNAASQADFLQTMAT